MNNGNGLERLLDAGQAAEILGLQKKTVYAWAEQGRLPAFRIGRALRFRESELLEYIEASRVLTGEGKMRGKETMVRGL